MRYEYFKLMENERIDLRNTSAKAEFGHGSYKVSL